MFTFRDGGVKLAGTFAIKRDIFIFFTLLTEIVSE